MGKRVFIIGIFVFCMSFLYGCSMVPDDEEIIKGSILENEIFGEEFVDEVLNDENLIDDVVKDIQNDVELVENVEEEENGNSEIQVEVAE